MSPHPDSRSSALGRWWWTIDRWVVAGVVALVVIGALLSMTASPPAAGRIRLDSLHFVRAQLLFLPAALAVMLATSMLSAAAVRRLAAVAFVVLLGLTALTLSAGPEIKGAQRWLLVGGHSLQPSEFLKPAFAVVAAWLFSERRLGGDLPGYGIATALALAIVVLLLLQPDLGNALMVAAIWSVEFFLAGLSLFWIVVVAALGIGAALGAYVTFDHVAARIDAFLNPDATTNYQVDTALEAFRSGGLFGRGPGEGTVKADLPDAHSDFVLAVAGEELGLIACIIIVGLFAFVVLRGLSRLLEENNLFVVLSVTGLLTAFGLQALVNMASTLHMVPTKGTTLPFVSYGGSSLLALAYGMGMVLALTRRRGHPGAAL